MESQLQEPRQQALKCSQAHGALAADSFLLVIPGLHSCGPVCCLTEARQKALSEGSGAPHCWLPAPLSLLTLMSGPPPHPLPPFPLPSSGEYIRDRISEQKLLPPWGRQSELTGFPGVMLAMQTQALRAAAASQARGWAGGLLQGVHRQTVSVTWPCSFEESQGKRPRGITAHS